MGEKDITEKNLEAYDDVFADIINVLLFHGKRIVSENELEDALPRSQYKADGKHHEHERDVAKYWRSGTFRIAFYGIENQTSIDSDIPLRVIGYDGGVYRAQLLSDKENKENYGKKNPRFPVVTLVLYFGYNRHWNKPSSLLECLEIPKELNPYVSDYKINIFEIAYLTDEQVAMFQSDFRIVADYFVQMRKNHDYIPSPDTIRHVHETLQLMAVMTQDHRFEDAYNTEWKGGLSTMCEVLDRIENKGISQGEDNAFTLVKWLIANNRMDDLKKATDDEVYRHQLLDELFSKEEK